MAQNPDNEIRVGDALKQLGKEIAIRSAIGGAKLGIRTGKLGYKVGKYAYQNIGVTPTEIGIKSGSLDRSVTVSRRVAIGTIAAALYGAYKAGQYSVTSETGKPAQDVQESESKPTVEPTKPAAAKPESKPEAKPNASPSPTTAAKPEAKPASPAQVKPSASPQPGSMGLVLPELVGIQQQFDKTSKLTIEVPEPVLKGFQTGGALGYAMNTVSATQFPLVRAIEYSPNTTPDIITAARDKGIFVDTRHVATLVEFDYLSFFAKQPSDIRAALLDAYAEGLVDGISTIYDPSKIYAFIIEAGHQSNAPMDKVEAARKDRASRNVQKTLGATLDTGTRSKIAEDPAKEITERELTHYLAKRVAIATANRTKWVPIINTRDGGYPVERFMPLADSHTSYIGHMDAILPQRFKQEERVMKELASVGITGFRAALHFNYADIPNPRDGFIMPQNAHFKAESEKLATAEAIGIQRRVQQVISDYECKVRTDINGCTVQPFWPIDSHRSDNPQLVYEGRYLEVQGATNKLFAAIRNSSRTGSIPPFQFEPC